VTHTKEEKLKKKEREKRKLYLLGFKTLNIKSRSNFSSQNIIINYSLRESVVLTTPFFFDFSFFVRVVRETTRRRGNDCFEERGGGGICPP
tara:strand:+ start:290 stop:562 length:273 start_codon:yes stop_codon:yes gene_type:complete